MKTITQRIRERLERDLPRRRPTLEELRNGQWSRDFEQLMRNRLVMGALRYETFAEKRSGHTYDLIGSTIERLTAYQETGNMEHLVDAANLCMIEFETPSHRNPNWESVDDGMHVEKR